MTRLGDIDPCLTGSPQTGASDGFWVFIDPPSRGDHLLQVRATSVFGTGSGTYRLQVR